MNGVYFSDADAPGRIAEQALALSGLSEVPAHSDVLFDAALSAALNLCGRNDVPREMELPIANILATLYQEGVSRPVSTVKRGDTAITYAPGGLHEARALLAPFIRLHSV